MQSNTPGNPYPTGSSAGGSNGGSESYGGEGSLNRASASAHNTVDQAASRAKPVIDRVASSAHQAVDKAVGMAGPTAEWLNEKGESLRQTQDRMITDTREYVTMHPMKAIGIALAAGLLIGRLMR
jgi:ElaB/YqjD/DUF883 family membrane-anchored ribosome-binding protein